MKKGFSYLAIIKFLILGVILVVFYLLSKELDFSLESLRTKIGQYPFWLAFLVFAALYAFVSVAPIAGRDVFKLIGALAWGWWISTIFIFVGEMLAATISFAMSRILGKELLDKLFGEKLKSSYEKLNDSSFHYIIVLRVLPITPYRFLNYAAGVTDLHFTPYIAGSAIGIFIRTCFFQGLFTLFADQLVKQGFTVGQIMIFSIGFAVVMLIFWIGYTRFKTENRIEKK